MARSDAELRRVGDVWFYALQEPDGRSQLVQLRERGPLTIEDDQEAGFEPMDEVVQAEHTQQQAGAEAGRPAATSCSRPPADADASVSSESSQETAAQQQQPEDMHNDVTEQIIQRCHQPLQPGQHEASPASAGKAPQQPAMPPQQQCEQPLQHAIRPPPPPPLQQQPGQPLKHPVEPRLQHKQQQQHHQAQQPLQRPAVPLSVQPPLLLRQGVGGEGCQSDEAEVSNSMGEAAAGEEGSEQDDDEEEGGQGDYDSQCCQCDDGGLVLGCDGPCMRAFHIGLADEELLDGSSTLKFDAGSCNPLGMPEDLARLLVNPDNNDIWQCPNCLASVQQCFKCKKEGKAGQDVFRCLAASCGRFYCPGCAGVAKGAPFICDLHRCHKEGCGGSPGLGELVPCRRCPRAYHSGCLPPAKVMPRTGEQALEFGVPRRVWLANRDEQGRLPDSEVERSLCYCRRHRIDPGLGSPQHSRPLLRPDLLKAWRLHYARQYAHLPSSRSVLRAEEGGSTSEEDVPLARLLQRKEQGAPRALAPLEAESGSDSDVPLLQRFPKARLQAASPTIKAKQRQLQQHEQQAAAQIAAAAAEVGGAATQRPAAAAPPPAKTAKPAAAVAAKPAAKRKQREAEVAVTVAAPQAAAAVEAALPAAPEQHAPLPSPAVPQPAGQQAQELQQQQAAAAVPPVVLCRRSQAELAALIDDLLHRAKRSVTLTDIKAETRQPKPYQAAKKKTVAGDTLSALAGSVAYAEELHHKSRGDISAVTQVLDRLVLRRIDQSLDDLTLVLAPYLHGARYSSYGRHFTDVRVLLRPLVDRLACFMRSGDHVVDFSCGANHFVPMVQQRCLEDGFTVTGQSYDIIQPKEPWDVTLDSWLEVVPGSRQGPPPGQHLVIGLNPPYGMRNSLAEQFIRKAADFRPRLIVLIVPPSTSSPPGYVTVYEDRWSAQGEQFYVPGSQHRSWNKTPPAVRILCHASALHTLPPGQDPQAWQVLPEWAAQGGAPMPFPMAAHHAGHLPHQHAHHQHFFGPPPPLAGQPLHGHMQAALPPGFDGGYGLHPYW